MEDLVRVGSPPPLDEFFAIRNERIPRLTRILSHPPKSLRCRSLRFSVGRDRAHDDYPYAAANLGYI
jgi:hypothetical protein